MFLNALVLRARSRNLYDVPGSRSGTVICILVLPMVSGILSKTKVYSLSMGATVLDSSEKVCVKPPLKHGIHSSTAALEVVLRDVKSMAICGGPG